MYKIKKSQAAVGASCCFSAIDVTCEWYVACKTYWLMILNFSTNCDGCYYKMWKDTLLQNAIKGY